MTDPTTPVIPAAQDLQINLDDAPKAEEITIPENKGPELNLNLDLNLSDAPKDDDRLKTEDQKNNQVVETPIVETPVVEVPTEVIARNEAIQNQEIITEMPAAAEPTLLETAPIIEPIVEPVVETPITIEPVAETLVETKPEEIVIPEVIEEMSVAKETSTPSTTIEPELITAEAPVELKEDMKIIDELEGHASAGGLAEEAVVTPQPTPVETPKTFDLDAMLGGPAIPTVMEAQPIAQAPMEMPPMPTVIATAPVMAPAFTIPTTTATVPVQAVMQTSTPQNKNK
jgi:hypothetical protein